MVLFVGAVGLFRFIRRKLGYKNEASLYRAVFAAYDVIQGLVARFGLVAQGLISIFLGLMILFGDFAISGLGSSGFNLGTFGIGGGFGVPYSFMAIVAGLGAIGSGISKLVEAARVSAAPGNTLVHGAARPAAETEAQAAARGIAKAPDLHNLTFKD